MQCVVQLRKQFVIHMFTDYTILLVIVWYTSLKVVFCVCILGQSRANSLSLLTVLTSNSLMSAGTRSPTLMCTISPGTRFRARNVSSCPSRKLKKNCVLDNKVIHTHTYIKWNYRIYRVPLLWKHTHTYIYIYIYINLHRTSLSQSSAQQLPCDVPSKVGYLCTMLRSVTQRLYWHQPSKCTYSISKLTLIYAEPVTSTST
jgi:hypothetical protein